VLRYSIDYFTLNWLGYYAPIFTYLDLSFYIKFVTPTTQQIIFSLALLFLNIYWILPLSLFLSGRTLSNLQQNIRRFMFIVARNLLFLPLLNIVLSQFSNVVDPFHTQYPTPSIILQFLAVISFTVFFIFLTAQSFLNF
jgi:hypothetical protein